ncbi:hypothetical protein HHI36_000274, partial [Cryptolaemus montrouzieri]
MLFHLLDDTVYEIEGIVKKDIEISELAKDLFHLTLNHGQQNIFMFNTENISNTSTLRSIIRRLNPIGKTTNLIITGELYSYEDQSLKNKIEDLELYLSDIVNKPDVLCISVHWFPHDCI